MKTIILSLILMLFTVNIILAQSFTNINAGIVGVDYSSSSSWGDYDNDGLLDIVICGEPNGGIDTTLLYHNDGNDNFSVVVAGTGFIDVSLGDVEWGDFNNDDYLDLLVIGYNNYVSVVALYINNGDGSFTESLSTGLPGVYMGDIDFADFDNDGYLDIGLLGFDNNYVFISKVFKNNHDLTFSEVSGLNLEGLNFGKFKWGDYDGDGYADFVINGYGDVDFVTELWKNNGDGSFSESNVDLHQGWLGDMAWGDYDADGDLDLVISGTGGDGSQRYTIIYQNNGDGSFTEVNSLYFPKVSHSSLEWADFDGDGDLDLFISGTLDAMGTGNYIGEIRYNNDGNFSESEQILPTYWGDCTVADYDNSGFPDIFICGYDVNENAVGNIYKNDRVTVVNSLELGEIQIGPIPAKESIRVSCQENILSYQIYQLSGEELANQKMEAKIFTIPVENLASGTYLLKLNSRNGTETQKITVL